MFDKSSANDWIRTADLWCRRRLFYQLSHNHCPIFDIIKVSFNHLVPLMNNPFDQQLFHYMARTYIFSFQLWYVCLHARACSR